MRVLIALALVGATAAPAAAQLFPANPNDTLRMHDLQMQMDATRQRMLATELEMQALDARLRTDQAARDIATQQSLPPLPPVSIDPNRPPPKLDLSQLASMPDDRLAASDAAVKDASENRR